jgi:hypothetical protein
VRYVTLIAALVLNTSTASAADFWQECQIEAVTLCTPDGCGSVEPTLRLYLGDFANSDGKRVGYYYRCRREGDCDKIEDPWIGHNDRYRVFVIREAAVVSRVDQDGKVTDVSTLDDHVLISRGTCWSAKPEWIEGQLSPAK